MDKLNKLTFREYWESKDRLMSAADETPKTQSLHNLNIYCKIPVTEQYDSDEVIYVSFKPNDKINIYWEHHDLMKPTAVKIQIISEDETVNYFPKWNNVKMGTWVDKNTTAVTNDNR